MSGEPREPMAPGDDELAAMLGARASRVGATDSREVLAAVRAQIAGPRGPAAGERGGRAFGLQPVRIDGSGAGGRRVSRMPWRVAVLGIAAVVAVALLGSRLSLDPADPYAGTSPSASAGASLIPGRSPVEMLTPDELDAGVLDGSLVGRTVLVFGHLGRREGRCRAVQPPPDGCWWLVFPGLEDRHIDPGSYRYEELGLALARHGGDEPVALHVLGSEVDLLGWVVDGADGSRIPGAFDTAGVLLDRAELALLDGWLAPPHGDAICVRNPVGGCDGPWARLTDTSPYDGGGAWTAGVPGLDVSIPESFGLDEDTDLMAGRFLVARVTRLGGSYAPYRVVAALDAEVQRVEQQVAPIDATPAPSPSVAPAGERMSAADFERAVRLGSLGDQLVVVEGRMRLVIGRCAFGGSDDCTWLQLEGLPNTWMDKGGLDVDEASAAIRRHPNVAPIALRVSGYGVELIGWITAGASTPVEVGALLAGDLPLDPGDVVVVGGWVVGAPADPPCAATPETCAMWPLLQAQAPPSDGAIPFGVESSAIMVADRLALGPAPASIEGPFLAGARRAPATGEPGFEIVDRFTGVVVVDPVPSGSASPMPSPTPAPSPAAPVDPARSLTNDELMTTLANGSLDGRLLAIDAELRTVAWPCPADVPEPCTRFFVDGLPGIALTYSGVIAGSDGSDGGAGVSAMTGRMIVVPRNAHLELLGRLDGSLEAPASLGPELALVDPDPLGLRTVNGWLVHTPAPSGCPPGVPNADVSCTDDENVLSPQPPEGQSLAVGAPRMGVVLRDGRPGLEGFGTFASGPFLVRPWYDVIACPGGTDCLYRASYGWEVVARYDPSTVLQVLLP